MGETPKGRGERRNHYQEVTARIITALEAGTPPWRRDWDTSVASALSGSAQPCNAASQRPYRGINRLLLSMDPRVMESGDPRFLTYDQAKAMKCHVRPGERATLVYFYKMLEIENEDSSSGTEKTGRIPLIKVYPVFHASQTAGIAPWTPPSIKDAPWRTPEAIEVIAKNFGVTIEHQGAQAYYAPIRDKVVLPPQAAFRTAEGYSATLVHELSHATAHSTRLMRWDALQNRFGSETYAMEELRAELASSFVCGSLDVNSKYGLDNHVSYIASWLEVLRRDPREIFRAAAEAQRIADWVLERHPEYARAAEAERRADAERQATREASEAVRDQERIADTPALPATHVAAARAAQSVGLEL